jgi:hypothetical protein
MAPGLDPAWLPAALALYRPIVDLPLPALRDQSWGDRSDHELANIGLRIGALTDVEVDSQVRELQIALRAGDGDLVRWYLRNRMRGVDFAVLSALPRMAGRDALCEVMRWRTSDGEIEAAAIGFPADSFPVGAALHAAVQRQVFMLCRDPHEAARWDAAYRRLAAPLRDPDRVIALLLADGP